MTYRYDVFLSYSRNDHAAAANLRAQFERAGLSVFRDEESIRAGDRWLEELQKVVDACGGFVVLVGRNGVGRWVGAETQVALGRHFGPQKETERLPIFPVLLDDSVPQSLPAFLRLFQVITWDGTELLPARLIEQIRDRTIAANDAIPFDGCPFVGLAAYQIDQAHLFFGRQKEALDAMACFETRLGHPAVRWLEINGNSGSGKSSLVNAGILPLVDQGWLWARTGYPKWRRIGPMMPGEHPVAMLAEQLARSFKSEMADVRQRLEAPDERALADWLRSRKEDDTALLIAIDQFEELFTFADLHERRRFDLLLATALADGECPLFLISTVRADFLDRFEELPRLVAVRNRLGRAWTLPPIGTESLREIISGPARLAGLDVGEVEEAIVAEARDEPGALPLVENALFWLWQQRNGGYLSGRLLTDRGGLAGILSDSADNLLASLASERERALELLFRLVKVDPDGRRHTRKRMPYADAVTVAGGGEAGRFLIGRLAGERARDGAQAHGPLRLIIVTRDADDDLNGDRRWVNLIHETLIRSKGPGLDGKPRPYWPVLWQYIEQHMDRAAWHERLQADVRNWLEKGKIPSHQWSHERVREAVTALTTVGAEIEWSDHEHEFLGPIDIAAMLAELEQVRTLHRRRAIIGERLDVLGDPRPGVGVGDDDAPQIDWCAVPGGEVTIVVERRPLPGTKQYRKAVQAFHIARYPITVAQYRAFLDAEDGWRNREWWASDLYRDPEGQSYGVGRFGNHPAVYVSWFDAMAFCRWLSRRLGLVVRLPDEWEWQQAATGGDLRNRFPWGFDWDAKLEPNRANTFESRIGSTTAVGMYPSGATAQGLLDMGGTVWEWCQNKHDAPDIVESQPRDFEPRVLRGGSWDNSQLSARCTNRYWFDALDRRSGLGFRVLCSLTSNRQRQSGLRQPCGIA